VENDPTHRWCLRWQAADTNEISAVDFVLFYSWCYNSIHTLFVCQNQKVSADKLWIADGYLVTS